VHLFDFRGDLYGEDMKVEFLKKIRDEKKFSTLEELKAQIERDAEEARRYLSQL